jgi:hypothetical protein
MSRKRHDNQLLGHDAFMDVVANLVGVLIILVVVLGGQTETLRQRVKDRVAQAYATATAKLLVPEDQANLVVDDIDRLHTQLAVYDRELSIRRMERGAVLAVLSEANREWENRRTTMAEGTLRCAELAAERRELLSLIHELDLESRKTVKPLENIVALEHLPTPMAQTVFGEEIHLRLKEGRLAIVPLDRLVEEIKLDFQRMLNGALREGERGGRVGPIREFTASYQVGTSRGRVSRAGQVGTAVKVELLGLVIEPVREPMGEPIAEALQENGQLAYEIAGRDPRRTTLTVWVYPDSFGEFRKVKEYLYLRGFATAARPLPEGVAISGSPNGSRSAAQ